MIFRLQIVSSCSLLDEPWRSKTLSLFPFEADKAAGSIADSTSAVVETANPRGRQRALLVLKTRNSGKRKGTTHQDGRRDFGRSLERMRGLEEERSALSRRITGSW